MKLWSVYRELLCISDLKLLCISKRLRANVDVSYCNFEPCLWILFIICRYLYLYTHVCSIFNSWISCHICFTKYCITFANLSVILIEYFNLYTACRWVWIATLPKPYLQTTRKNLTRAKPIGLIESVIDKFTKSIIVTLL